MVELRFTAWFDGASQLISKTKKSLEAASSHCKSCQNCPERCLKGLADFLVTRMSQTGQKWKLAQLNSMSVLPSTADIGGMMPHVRLGALKPEHHCHHCGAKMPHLHHDLCVHPAAPTGQGQANDSSVP